MDDLDKRVKTYLVIAGGFSRINADIAIQMYHEDQLSDTMKEVIKKIFADPDMETISYYKLSHLNYQITCNGGSAKTQSRIK